VSAGLAGTGWAVVAPGDLAYVTRALADAISCHENHRRRTPVTAAYSRILDVLAGRGRASVRQLSPGAAEVAGTGPLGDLAAAVEGLDGSERKLLLGHLADSDPAVIRRWSRLASRGWRSTTRATPNGAAPTATARRRNGGGDSARTAAARSDQT
jgi:hypothetical protein